jgi:hypothetical protein
LVLNEFLKTELFVYFDEYFFSDFFPLLMEWQVIRERFTDPDWCRAYKIKLAANHFAGLGQLCISLAEVLDKGKDKLSII